MPKYAQYQDEQQERTKKSIVLAIIVTFFFMILLMRLFYIQIIQAERNIRLSRENQMELKTLKASRGIIFDRNGVVLARNRPSYSICILPYKINNRVNIINNLLKIRDTKNNVIFDSLKLVKRIRKAYYRKFDITRLKEDVSIEVVSIIEEHVMELPGIIVQTEPRREYPMEKVTFHALGYMNEIPEKTFDSLKEIGYRYGDKIGKSGLEKQYESILRGKDGHEYIEVNAYGRNLGAIDYMPHAAPVSGKNIYLSIDSRLQEVAANSFPDSLKGAVVAINPQNGEVLVIYSSPSVDPNIFSLSTNLKAKSWALAALDSNLPLNNRAVVGTYPPGSTFKLVSGIASLSNGDVTQHSYFQRSCTGAFRIGNRIAHCWNLSGHGRLNLVDAIKVSCNIYFYQVGLKTGSDIINKYAAMYSLGSLTGIDLPHEKSGWLSGEDAYNKRFKRRGWTWTKGLVLDLAIGQTQLVTPLQLAVMIGGMGNGSSIYTPRLLKEVRTHDGSVLNQTTPQLLHTITIDSANTNTIRVAMNAVIDAPGGTGRRSRVKGILVGGKSGSSQNPHGEKTHGLFVACAPIDNPVIAIAAIVENGGHGGTVAAPIVGNILRYFFSNTKKGQALVIKYAEMDME